MKINLTIPLSLETYLCAMRVLLLLLTSLLFITNPSMAGKKISKVYGENREQVSETAAASSSSIVHLQSAPESLLHFNNNRQRTSFPSRANAFIPAILLVSSLPFIIAEEKFHSACVDKIPCKRIGLQLLFPQHYFW